MSAYYILIVGIENCDSICFGAMEIDLHSNMSKCNLRDFTIYSVIMFPNFDLDQVQIIFRSNYLYFWLLELPIWKSIQGLTGLLAASRIGLQADLAGSNSDTTFCSINRDSYSLNSSLRLDLDYKIWFTTNFVIKDFIRSVGDSYRSSIGFSFYILSSCS